MFQQSVPVTNFTAGMVNALAQLCDATKSETAKEETMSLIAVSFLLHLYDIYILIISFFYSLRGSP